MTQDRRGEELPLDGLDARLPWLDDDEGEQDGSDSAGRLLMIVLVGLLLLAIVAAGIWFAVFRDREAPVVEVGGVIEAPDTPYRVRPENPGGRIAYGTGDSSFLVAEGRSRPVRLGQSTRSDDAPLASASGADASSEAPQLRGVGVQVGAFPTEAEAKAAWSRLAQRYPLLAERQHQVVEGKADLAPIFALQALAPDTAAAKALCRELRQAGLNCQVKAKPGD